MGMITKAAAALAACGWILAAGAGAHAQGTAPRPAAPVAAASPLVGRWADNPNCRPPAVQFVFTNERFEIIGRDGRWYLANVAYLRQGADLAIRVTAAPTFSRLDPRAAPGMGDIYVFRNDPVNRITPTAIVRANGRRDQVGPDTPVFTRCR
jgi:hypothetical protein